MSHHRMIRMLLASALAGLAACASRGLGDEEMIAQAPVVNASGAGRTGEVEARTARDAAREAYVRGDDRECLRIVREALASGAPEPVASELRALRFEARRRLLSREVMEARVVPRRDFVVFGGEIVLDLSLRNATPDALVVPVSDAGASDAVFVLDWTRRDFDIYGNVLLVSGRDLVALPSDADLPPAGRFDLEFRLGGDRTAGQHRGFTEYVISGTFRPSVIRSGDERYYEGVEMRPVAVRLLPEGYGPIAEDPVGTMQKAIALNAPDHLLVAGELTPRERRREVAGLLLDALEAGVTDPMAVAVSVVLGRLTGVPRPAEPAGWLEWKREGGLDGLR